MANPEEENSGVTASSVSNTEHATTTESPSPASTESNGARPPGGNARMAGMGMGGGMGGGGGMSLKDLRTFTSFKNSVFRLYYFAMLGQMGAMNMQMVARAWFMYELTDSAALLGAVSLANGLPLLVLSLYSFKNRNLF